MKKEGNPNAEATDMVVKKLVSEVFNKIIEGAKTASEAIGTEGNEAQKNERKKNIKSDKKELYRKGGELKWRKEAR